MATVTIGFFAEFRNDGKFHLKQNVHFFGAKTWGRYAANDIYSGLGDFFGELEKNHFNDFIMGPAIVSVLFALVFWRIRAAVYKPLKFAIT